MSTGSNSTSTHWVSPTSDIPSITLRAHSIHTQMKCGQCDQSHGGLSSDYRYNDTLGREMAHVYKGSQESLHWQESCWWTKKVNPTGSELLGWSLAGETTYKTTQTAAGMLSCKRKERRVFKDYFPLISYMTRLTTRGLAPCLGTPCNELGYCPSLGLPALEHCNTAYEIETRGMGSKFTLYCQLTPGLWSRMCNFHPMGWCSTTDGGIDRPVTDNTSREDFRARHLVHFSQLLA